MKYYPLCMILCGCLDYSLTKDIDTSTDDGVPMLSVNTDLSLGTVCSLSTEALRLTNQGTATLSISELLFEGVTWQVDEQTFPLVIEPGQDIDLSLSPQYGEGTLVIASNDPQNPQTRVPLAVFENQPPILDILSPTDGDVIDLFPTEMIGNISDDMDLAEYILLQWRSSIDGVFSIESSDTTGHTVAQWVPYHTPGQHLIQLMASDSCGATATDIIGICQRNGYVASEVADVDLVLEGSALRSGSGISFASNFTSPVGAAFSSSTQLISNGVAIDFQFLIEDASDLEGFAVVGLNTDLSSGFLGSGAGCLGYGYHDSCSPMSIALPGWAVEMDFRSNEWDPSEFPHIAFHQNGRQDIPQVWRVLPDVTDQSWHHVKIEVRETLLTVDLDGQNIVLHEMAEQEAFPSYIGFVSSGGKVTFDSIVVSELECAE